MIKKFLQRISNHQTQRISAAALILSIASFLSFVLGLIRDRLLTSSFGAGNELDVYYTAFRIPDFIALVLMTGAISVAVVPIFTQNLVKSKEKAFSYLANLLNVSLLVLILVCAVLFILAPQLTSLIAPGFSMDKKEITTLLTRIMFISPILMGISNIISAVLRIFQRFLITALAPIVYNLGSIVGILFFVPIMGIKGLAWGIVFGALMHLLIQAPALFKTGFKIKKIFSFFDSDFLLTIKLTIPRAIGLAATQINLIVITIIGSTLLAGSVSVFNLANDLSLPIIGLIAVPFAVAVFPALSLSFAKGEKEALVQKFVSVFRQILFLIIPLSGLAFILRAQLVRIVFGAGRFDWTDTKLTAACFGVFMLGLFAQGLIYLVSKTFYSVKNTVIPTIASIISVAINTALAYSFVWALSFNNAFSNMVASGLKIQGMKNLAVVGLPLAVSLSAIFQLVLLLLLLKKKIGDFKAKELLFFFGRVLLVTTLTMALSYFLRQMLGGFLGSETFIILFLQTSVVGILGLVIYLLTAGLFRLPEVKLLRNFILSQLPNSFSSRNEEISSENCKK
ncbi:murein biosynthesis integral membrane protein MurJ [Patescibacteria group bacterium]|nr:murein biosynthesis integral membrane protein MurJ [Patescibacteria group bacterium]MBU4367672.1 murein biosynthesis integral membrane protein MurJ [Patescibacteria group bacterium]MBU4461878.1 murein biosynthesis integral membrane protein MurJ [Patescibacteria group bacterium]MCG2699991.1 murein biosynthesis integral membrane protein MurJ [Candidatus Parcubacteria bacterium]